MSIKEWPAEYQPREKLLQTGASSLTDAELLAIFIRTGSPGATAIHKAHELLANFGNIKTLLDQPLEAIMQFQGLGKAKYVQLQAALEIAQRYLSQHIRIQPATQFHCSNSVKKYLRLYFRNQLQEIVVCLYLTQQHQLINTETLCNGSINHAPIIPRQIVARAIFHKSSAIVLAHNHPSVDCTPSRFDKIGRAHV